MLGVQGLQSFTRPWLVIFGLSKTGWWVGSLCWLFVWYFLSFYFVFKATPCDCEKDMEGLNIPGDEDVFGFRLWVLVLNHHFS